MRQPNFYPLKRESLTSFTFHLTFDKQLSKIQKVQSGLPSTKFQIWPSLILKLCICGIQVQKGRIFRILDLVDH